jgi:hypothetical protein
MLRRVVLVVDGSNDTICYAEVNAMWGGKEEEFENRSELRKNVGTEI